MMALLHLVLVSSTVVALLLGAASTQGASGKCCQCCQQACGPLNSLCLGALNFAPSGDCSGVVVCSGESCSANQTCNVLSAPGALCVGIVPLKQ